jgi:hypothetical protein
MLNGKEVLSWLLCAHLSEQALGLPSWDSWCSFRLVGPWSSSSPRRPHRLLSNGVAATSSAMIKGRSYDGYPGECHRMSLE